MLILDIALWNKNLVVRCLFMIVGLSCSVGSKYKLGFGWRQHLQPTHR